MVQDIIIGSDHRGYELKQKIKEFLREKKLFFIDVGVQSADKPADSLPIPPIINVVKEVTDCVAGSRHMRGILICANGIGSSIAANRFKGIRAALCCSPAVAKLAREDNDANVLVLAGGGKEGLETPDIEIVKKTITTFINTRALEDTRYVKRRALFDTLG